MLQRQAFKFQIEPNGQQAHDMGYGDPQKLDR